MLLQQEVEEINEPPPVRLNEAYRETDSTRPTTSAATPTFLIILILSSAKSFSSVR